MDNDEESAQGHRNRGGVSCGRLSTFAVGICACVLFRSVGACSTSDVQSQDDPITTSTVDSLRSQFQFPARAATDGTSNGHPAQSVIPDPAVASFTTTGTGFVPNSTTLAATVTLPATADGATGVATTDGKMRVDVKLHGASSSVHAATSGGHLLYANADSHGGHFIQTIVADGVEHFVTLSASPKGDIVFDVAMTNVEGLRLVEGVLEFLDDGGSPRLRMTAPAAVDSLGIVAPVSIDVPGCSYDTSPTAPWSRKVTAPGATSCAVHLSWSDSGLTYPVLLDPTWSTTASMATARRWHGAALLPNMKTLVVGGEGTSSSYLTSCELYNATTNTWASTGAMATARRRAVTIVTNGLVLVAGGETSNIRTASAERYNPSTGTWSSTGSMATSRAYHDAVYLDTGKILVAGGMDLNGNVLSSAELFDPTAGTWSVTGSFITGRQNLTLTRLRSGKILAGGGVDGASNVLTSAEIYDPSAPVWTATGSLNTARHRHERRRSATIAFSSRAVTRMSEQRRQRRALNTSTRPCTPSLTKM